MPEWKVPLADLTLSDDEIETVAEVYRSGWLTMGPHTERFEERLAEYTGAAHVLALTNGTAALHLACLAAGLGPGDEAIVPSMTFVASVNAIAYTGARPVFAEIAGLTKPWLSAAAAEAAITPRTRAIMTVAYGGHPGETEALAELAARRGLVLIEDAAHAAGSRLHGRHLGTFGKLGAFSFFSNKNLAVGEGGAVVTDDPELAQRLRLLRSHGMTTLTWDRHRGHASDYDVVELGFNYRIDEPRAALAGRRLEHLDADNLRRAELDRAYRSALADVDGVTVALAPRDDARQSHHLCAVILDPGVDRAEVRAQLAERGIQTSVHYPPVHRFAIYTDPDLELPVTDAYGSRALTLPLFAHMRHDQLELVVDALRTAIARTPAARV